MPKVLLALPVLFLVCYYFFPESPYYLMQSHQIQAAERSLRFYRDMNSNADKKLEEVFQSEFLRLKLAHEEQAAESKDKPSVAISDFGN